MDAVSTVAGLLGLVWFVFLIAGAIFALWLGIKLWRVLDKLEKRL